MTPPPGWRLRHHETVPSTSDLCATLAQAGEPAGLAVLAARQSHARGSRGRGWTTLPGNLALSVLLRPTSGGVGHWALLAAVALAEALVPAPVQVKWPNDVMLGGAKLGGVLLDASWAAEGRLDWLVIGFGANLAATPDLPGVAALPDRPDPRAVACALLGRLDHWVMLLAGEGFGPVRRAWMARGPAPGTLLRVTAGPDQVAGTFAGLGDDGSLLLQSGGRVHAFCTGRVLQAGE